MEITLTVGAKSLKMHVDTKLLAAIDALGWKDSGPLGELSKQLSEKLGFGVAALNPSIFTDLVDEAIRVRGEKNFRSLLKIKEPAFALLDKAPMVAGYDSRGPLFYINKIAFDLILPAMPDQKYQRAWLQTIITHIFLVAVGGKEEDVIPDDTYFAAKLLGSVQEASKMNTIFNRVMREGA